MPTKAFTRGNELRQKIKQAKENETITLPLKSNDFGEYQGPIVLEKPISLIGKGDKTPLLGKGCPALIVLSAGIKLKDIEIADSFDATNGVALLVCDGVQPTLDNVKINGQTMTMSKEQIIDLGDFLPQQQASSYFEIEVTGPSRVKCAESSEKWLRVSPENLPASGKHLLQFTCDGGKLGPDAFAAGSVEISGSTVKTLWVTVHVLPVSPVKPLTDPIALVLGKDHRIRFADGFLIGKNKLPGVPAASSIAERQAIILKDTVSGIWTIYQPWQTPMPTTVNGQALFQGQRICLQDGYILRMGSLELKVEVSKGSGVYSVNKSTLDLSGVGDTSGDKGFKLQYDGGGKDKPKISTTVPWLEVKPDALEFRKGDIKDVFVSLTPAISSLPKTKIRERSAILVQTKNETLSLDVSIDTKAEPIIPRAVPDPVKLGNVSDWKKSQTTLTLYNDGTHDWHPMARVDCDWMDVEPVNSSVPAGKSASLIIRLNQKVENLPSPSDQKVFISFDGDGALLKISVSAQLQIVKAEPSLDTPLLDFKELNDVSQASPAILIIRNKGKKEWQAIITSKITWLDVLGDSSFILPGGGQKTIPIQLNGNLPVGEFSITDAILVDGEGKSLSAAVKVKLKPPISSIEIFPRLIDFGKIEDPKSAPEQKVAFRNRGSADWSGTVTSSVSWLAISPAGGTWKCTPKAEVVVSFRITEQVPEGQHNIADAVTFEGPGGPYKLPLRVEFLPQPKMRSIPVNFGEVTGLESAPLITIPVYNDGNQDWDNVNVTTNVPWITVSPDNLKVQKLGKADIRVRLNEKMNGLSSGEHSRSDAIVLSGSGIVLPIDVKLVLPQIELQAPDKEIKFMVEYENVVPILQQKLVIANIGRRDWSGKIESRVPWLKVEPENVTIGVKGRLSIIVSTTDDLRTLSTGEQLFGSLIAFENSALTLDVRVNIKKIAPKSDLLDFEPSPLDFGKIEPGISVPQNRQISVYSELDWQADIIAQDDWFAPIKGKLSGSAGKTYLSVEVRDGISKLSEGVHWSELVFTIQNGKRFTLPVKIEKSEILPDVIIRPTELNFFWNVGSTETQSQKLLVENKSNKDWEIWLEPEADWLDVIPSNRVLCSANGKVEFQVVCSPSKVNGLKDGKYTQELTMRVGPRHRMPCQIVLNLDRSVAEWSVQPEGVISLGTVEKSADGWNNHPVTELTLQNRGEHPIDFQILYKLQSNPWFEVPGALKVPGKSSRRMGINLKRDAWSYLKMGKQEGIVEIVGSGKSVQMVITLQLVSGRKVEIGIPYKEITKELPEKLILDRQQISFSQTDMAKWRSEPPQFFTVQNPNGAAWSGQVKAPAWITVSPSRLDLEPYSRTSIEVKLKSSPFGSEKSGNLTGVIEIYRGSEIYSLLVGFGGQSIPDDKAPGTDIISKPSRPARGFLEGKSQTHSTNVEQSAPFHVTPLLLDFGVVMEWASNISQIIKIQNLGNKDLKVTLKPVKWLNVPEELVIPAGQMVDVKVFLKQLKIFEKPTGTVSEYNGVVISTLNQSVSVRVDIQTK